MLPSVQLNDDESELLMHAGYVHVEGALIPQPISLPQFTLTELKNAIPAHCFERSMVNSFAYLAFDVAIIISLLCCAYDLLESQFLPLYCELIAYPFYWFVQGSFLFAIWVLAHECGHGAFSESNNVNDIVGLIIHSALLTPYHSWKITHRKHHSNTGSCENDEVYVPYTEDEVIRYGSENFNLVSSSFISCNAKTELPPAARNSLSATPMLHMTQDPWHHHEICISGNVT